MSLANPLSNAIRALSMDAVQRANSGHPGAPMGMADIAQVLWMDFLAHSPSNPNWPNRDRFVLSNGHGSMLIYALLHLTGYDLSIDDLKQFRQLHSKTPGHPEFGYTPGVETTTGPLGQGIANAVGMALAEKIMAAHFNRDGHTIVDHYTYCFLGDGCLMEGISHEACSFAGTQKLNKLIAFWDDNGISIDGDVNGWFNDNTPARFEAYGWSVIRDVDGHDAGVIAAAIKQAKAAERPTLICCKTTIGRGAPNKEGTHGCHGAPLGDDEIAAARANLDWSHAPFDVPETVYQQWDARESGKQLEVRWQQAFAAYQQDHPELAAEFTRRVGGELPASFDTIADQYIAKLHEQPAKLATRKASQNAIEALAPAVPELIGGSADLAGSNLTLWSGSKGIFADDAAGNYLYFGVREFAMTAIQNGLCLHGGLRTYSATFLIFMEYARNAVRMAALMKQPAIYVYTHDSIGLGEDGPTHQPVEQLVALRATPNLSNWRPCDQVETAVAWKAALKRSDGPTALILTRQGVAQQARDQQQLAAIERGGYVLKDTAKAQVILIATGSEVELAVAASEQLAEQGIAARVVSMPSTDVFVQQSTDYQESVLPSAVRARVAVEALATDSWYRFVGIDGAIVGMTTFGESGPAGELYQHFNITVDAVVASAKQQVNG